MRRSRKLRLIAMLAVGATVAAVASGLASAGQIIKESFHEEEAEVVENFCDVAGLTVNFGVVRDGRAHVVLHGRDQLPYFAAHIKETQTVTNLANGKTVISTSSFIDKDLRVTDNGDGTSTLLILLTGISKLYGDNGKVVAMDPGQIRIELLFDNGGTPSDPTDDEEIAFLGVVKDSTGRSDDFCEAAVPILTATP
jgi:hypothetical protein